MLCLFVVYIFWGSLTISFCRCYFCCIFLLVGVV
jgi:hypothetical protein